MATTPRLVTFALFLAVTACACKDDQRAGTGAKDAAGAVSLACSAPDQDRCREIPQPSAEQRSAVTIECGSASGKLSSPAACPTAGFIGKCTTAATGKDGPEVRRWYKAADAAYQQDFCVNTAKGVWSTAF
jgi:hypothetical protein